MRCHNVKLSWQLCPICPQCPGRDQWNYEEYPKYQHLRRSIFSHIFNLVFHPKGLHFDISLKNSGFAHIFKNINISRKMIFFNFETLFLHIDPKISTFVKEHFFSIFPICLTFIIWHYFEHYIDFCLDHFFTSFFGHKRKFFVVTIKKSFCGHTSPYINILRSLGKSFFAQILKVSTFFKSVWKSLFVHVSENINICETAFFFFLHICSISLEISTKRMLFWHHLEKRFLLILWKYQHFEKITLFWNHFENLFLSLYLRKYEHFLKAL